MSEKSPTHHHSSHHETGSGKSKKHSKSSKSSGHSKSRKNVSICIGLNALLIVVAIALGILSKGNTVFGVALFAMFNLPILLLAYFSLKLRKIPSYEYKADLYKQKSASMLTVGLPIALVLAGVLLMMGLNRIDDDTVVVNPLFLIIGGLTGTIINALCLMLLKRAKTKTTACNAVYVSTGIATLVSVATVCAGTALWINELFINADPYITILVALAIAATAVWVMNLFNKRAFHMLPDGIEIEQVISTIKLHENVKNYRHLNIWKNNAEEVELSAHLSLDDMDKMDVVKSEINEGLRKMGIDIVTLAFKKHKEEE